MTKRVESFAERLATKNETVDLIKAGYYVCGCGGELWILTKSGDCVCASCMRAQARIIVSELAPVKQQGKSGNTP
jgi:hypothetical protein